METLTQPQQRTEEPPKEANEEADTSQRRGRSSRRNLTSICEISEVIFTTFFSVFLEVWGERERLVRRAPAGFLSCLSRRGVRVLLPATHLWLPTTPKLLRGCSQTTSSPCRGRLRAQVPTLRHEVHKTSVFRVHKETQSGEGAATAPPPSQTSARSTPEPLQQRWETSPKRAKGTRATLNTLTRSQQGLEKN